MSSGVSHLFDLDEVVRGLLNLSSGVCHSFVYLHVFIVFLLLFFVLSGSVVILWTLTLIWTLYFVVIMTLYGVDLLVVYNYFLFQEVLGLLFVIGLGSLPSVFLLAKLGVSPFHAWGFYVLEYLNGQVLIWFLVYQKLTIIPGLILVLLPLSGLLLWGLVLIYLQVLGLSRLKSLVFISSTESASWLILLSLWRLRDFYFLILVYFASRVLAIGSAYEAS